MLEVIDKIKVLYDTLQIRLNHYNTELVGVRTQKVELDKREKGIAEGEKNLRVREKAVEDRERKVGHVENLLALEDKVSSERAVLHRERDEFNKDSSGIRKALEDDRNALNIRRKKVVERSLALDREKKEYKEKLRDELLREVARKR